MMPASARARAAHVMQTGRSPPPDSSTKAKTSTVVLGNVFNITAPSKALCSIVEYSLCSIPWLSLPRTEVENVAKLTLQFNLPMSLYICAFLLSLGPNTDTMTFVLPNSAYADPEAAFTARVFIKASLHSCN
eukprot:Gb_13180 [translate_table: standard]